MTSSIGSESVSIVPDARGFKEKLEAQLRNLPSVQIQLDSAAATLKIEAVKQQVRSIGSGKAKITADTADVDAKIAGIKAQLAAIQQDRLKVNIDTAEATAKISALRLQEKALKDEISGFQAQQGNNSVPVQAGRDLQAVQAQISALQNQRIAVRVDTAEAEAKIAALRAELDAATRERNARINVDDGGSSANVSSKIKDIGGAAATAAAGTVGRMVLIGGAIAAIIPIAAAASIAVAGIGAGIGLGILGALVGKLALGGVGTALTASKTPTGGGNPAQQAEQVAAAVQAQRQAEISLTTAQRQAAQAQRDLTQARIDAANALQNLTDQVADNGLAQRQASLDLTTAQQNLTVAKANPDAQNPANATALAQIQLAYDQAKQNVQDLADSGSQLAQQQASAAAAGVDGAANVVSAQNQVVDTANAVQQAQFDVADSAAKAAIAQQGAAGSASAYQQALAKLNPAQQQFVKFLQSIGPQLGGLKSAATDGLLPQLQKAILIMLPALPQISRIVGDIAGAFGQLAIDAASFFTSPDGDKFLTFIENNVGPAIDTFGKIFGGFFSLGLSIFEQAYPLIKSFGDGIAGALGDANKNVQGGALNGFFDFIKTNAPQIKQTFKDVAGAVASILKSFAPDAPAALKAVSGIAKDLAGLAKVVAPLVKDLLPFAPIILAVVIGLSLMAPLIGIGGPIGIGIAAITILATGLTTAFIDLYNHSKTFRDIVGDIALFFLNDLLPIGAQVAGFFLTVFTNGVKAAEDILGGLSEAITGIASGFLTTYDKVKNWAGDVVSVIKGIPGDIKNIGADMLAAGGELLDKLGQGLSGAVNGVGDVAKNIVNAITTGINKVVIDPLKDFKVSFGPFGPYTPFHSIPEIQRLAKGGIIGGIGGPTSDNQLILGSPGEFVMPAAQTARHLPELYAMRNGQQVKGTQVTQNIYPSAAMDETGLAALVSRRIQFYGV